MVFASSPELGIGAWVDWEYTIVCQGECGVASRMGKPLLQIRQETKHLGLLFTALTIAQLKFRNRVPIGPVRSVLYRTLQ